MKKTILFIVVISLSIFAFGQKEEKTENEYKNEFGIDATGFIKQFVNLNTSEYQMCYFPNYYLTYRRRFKGGNIRFAFGGKLSEQDNNGNTTDSYAFNTRVGWEFINSLNIRWKVFYGVDLKTSYNYSKNDIQYWNGGYANGKESKTNTYAISPLLGFKFKLTKRLSLSTEANLSFIYQNSYVRSYYTPVSEDYPPIDDVISPDIIKKMISFYQPSFIIITFDI